MVEPGAVLIVGEGPDIMVLTDEALALLFERSDPPPGDA